MTEKRSWPQKPSSAHGGRNIVSVRLSPKVFRFLTHRRHADRLTLQNILSAAVVAYVVGDLEVTPDGYRIRRDAPDDPTVFIEHPDGSREAFTMEDAELTRELTHHATARPSDLGLSGRGGWGTRDVAKWATKQLGRPISTDTMRRFLLRHYEKPSGHNWYFSGPDDPMLEDVLERLKEYGPWGMTEHSQRKTGISKKDIAAAKRRHREIREAREAEARRRAEKKARKKRQQTKS